VSVQFGIDRYLNEAPPMRNARIALVTNHAACTSSYLPSRQALLGRGFQVTRLFSPEHGLQTAGADGGNGRRYGFAYWIAGQELVWR
jgi:uncharacterized protein YbbC (DUF1343 family)